MAGQNSWNRGRRKSCHPQRSHPPTEAQVRWAGYVTRMPDSRLLKQLLYVEFYQRKALGWGAEETFQRLHQRVSQRPGHQRPLAWQSHHWGPCGRKPTDRRSTEERAACKDSDFHLHCSTHTLMSYVWTSLLGSDWPQ